MRGVYPMADSGEWCPSYVTPLIGARVASGGKTRINAAYCNAQSDRGGVNDQPGFLAALGMTIREWGAGTG